MKNSQKVIHAIGRFFLKLARYFFDRTILACWCCGDLVGMRSNYVEGHMWCEPCFQRYVAPRRYAAEHCVHLTDDGLAQTDGESNPAVIGK